MGQPLIKPPQAPGDPPSPRTARTQAMEALLRSYRRQINELLERRIREGYFDAQWDVPFDSCEDHKLRELMKDYAHYKMRSVTVMHDSRGVHVKTVRFEW